MRARTCLAVFLPMLSVALAIGDLRASQDQAKPPMPAAQARDNTAPPRPGTAFLSGTLVAADTAKPVRRATVTLAGQEIGFRKSATTDEMGRFSFAQIPAGQFTLSATRSGYLDVTFGQRTPGSGRPGTPIQLIAGQRLEDLSLAMPRTGILTGLITDEFGDPAMGMQVRAWRFVKRSGERTLQQAGASTTDDRGIYRIPGLVPGEYLVGTMSRDTSESAMLETIKLKEALETRVAMLGVDGKSPAFSYEMSYTSGSGQPTVGYASVYFPGTLQASSATSIPLGISEERGGVDLQLQAVPLATVSGSVIGPDGSPPPGGEVRLVETGATLPTARTFSGPVRPDGSFLLSSVPPGQYTLYARTNPKMQVRLVTDTGGDGKTVVVGRTLEVYEAAATVKDFKAQGMNAAPDVFWGQTELAVDGRPLTNVVLSLQRGLDVSGLFAFDGPTPQPPDLSRIRVQLTPAATAGADASLPSPSAVYSAGRFALQGVIPGRYRLNVGGLPPGWTVKTAMFGGRDVLDTMLEVKPGDEMSGGIVTFTNQSTELSGALQDQSGKPVADYTIVVLATDRRFWTPLSRRIQATRPSTDGRFSFRNLPAGDYRLIAVVDPEPGEWFDPAFLEQLVGATMSVTLNEGEKKTQDVRIVK